VSKGADLYAALGVTPAATADELKTAYRELARQHHPDHARSYLQKVAATRRMQAINAAYAVLRDPQRRAAYDAERAAVLEKPWQWPGRTAGVPPPEEAGAPFGLAADPPPNIAPGMVLAGAAIVLLVSGRAHWSLAPLFLLAQLAYCYWTECVDDWIWGLGVGLLAFVWVGFRNPRDWLLPAFVFPQGIDWQVALVAASGATAIFIGVRQLRRRRNPWL
jgi:DnaJ domain